MYFYKVISVKDKAIIVVLKLLKRELEEIQKEVDKPNALSCAGPQFYSYLFSKIILVLPQGDSLFVGS